MKALFVTLLSLLALSQIQAQEWTATVNGHDKKKEKAAVDQSSEEDQTSRKGKWYSKVVLMDNGAYKGSLPSEAPLKEKWIGEAIYSVDLTDIENKRYTLGAKSDRVTVLNLWFAECVTCIENIPNLNELVTEFANEKVDFLALTLDSKERITQFLSKTKFDYKIIPDAREHMGKIWTKGDDKVKAIEAIYPMHLVIDQQGIVKELILGAKEDIKELLKEAIQAQL